MRTGQVAKQFNITPTAVRQWIDRYADFLTDAAKAVDTRNAEIGEQDFIVLATVHELVHKEKLSHNEAMKRLASGYRIDDVSAYRIEPDFIPAPAVEQLIDATDIRIELQEITKERDLLYNLLERERDENRELQAKLDATNERIIELSERAARAEMEAKMLRERWEQDRE